MNTPGVTSTDERQDVMGKGVAERLIAVTFNGRLTNTFIELSARINGASRSRFVLNRSDAYPHMTIYTTNFPTKNLGKVEAFLHQLVQGREPLNVKFSSKTIVNGTIFLEADLSAELVDLHRSVVEGLNPLREGLYDKRERDLPGFTAEMERSLIQYGMWAAMELYLPHVTIARPVDSSLAQKALSVLPDTIDYSDMLQGIVLAERGPDGTCKKILETFPFA